MSMSRPTRACELKFTFSAQERITALSRPTRACELKFTDPAPASGSEESRPTRACELKFTSFNLADAHRIVTPYTGV